MSVRFSAVNRICLNKCAGFKPQYAQNRSIRTANANPGKDKKRDTAQTLVVRPRVHSFPASARL